MQRGGWGDLTVMRARGLLLKAESYRPFLRFFCASSSKFCWSK